MSAREALINAYDFYIRTPDSAGDNDLGARGSKITTRRKSRAPSWSVDPQHATQTRQKAVNTTKLVGDAMMAGKIISAAERGDPHVGAYARIYYGNPLRGDYAKLYGYLAGVCLKRTGGNMEMLSSGHELIKAYAMNRLNTVDQAVNNPRIDDIVISLILSLDRGCLSRVGVLLANS